MWKVSLSLLSGASWRCLCLRVACHGPERPPEEAAAYERLVMDPRGLPAMPLPAGGLSCHPRGLPAMPLPAGGLSWTREAS